LRRDAGFDIADRIIAYIDADDAVMRVVREFQDFVMAETLSREIIAGPAGAGAHSETQSIDGRTVLFGIQRASA
jgi:hypothetical protein